MRQRKKKGRLHREAKTERVKVQCIETEREDGRVTEERRGNQYA